jgi:hypothetical protein
VGSLGKAVLCPHFAYPCMKVLDCCLVVNSHGRFLSWYYGIHIYVHVTYNRMTRTSTVK